MKKFNKSLLVAALLCGTTVWGGNGAQAQEVVGEFDLDTMVVTATRTLKEIQEVPAAVSVVTAKEIQEKNIISVTEALQTVSGVYMAQGAQGGIQMRGFESNNIMVLVDGMQMNTAYGNDVIWEMIPVENIERIEVVKGAASSLYGGRAVGGVINIITKEKKEKGVSVNTLINYGSNNTWKKALYTDVRANDKIYFGVGYEQSKSDGYVGYHLAKSASKLKNTTKYVVSSEPVPQLSNGKYDIGNRGKKRWENENISANVKYDFDKSKSLKYTFNHSESENTTSNPTSNVFIDGKNTFYKGNILARPGYYISSDVDGYLGYKNYKEYDRHTLSYNDIENKFAANFGYLDVKKDGYSQPNGATSIDYEGAGNSSYHPGESYDFDVQKAWENIGKHSIVVGGSFKQESFDQEWTMLSKWRDDGSIDTSFGKNGLGEIHGGKARNVALFIQDEYKLSEPVTMYTGLRFDYWKKFDGYSEFFNGKGGAYEYDAKSYTELSPKLAFNFKADEATNYYVSYGHSFNPPELFQVYRNGGNNAGSVIANPDLDPETSDTFEIGMKKKLAEKTQLNVSLYHVKTDDKVVYFYHYAPGTTTTEYKQYENWGTEKRYGIELDLAHGFNDNLSAYFNYAYQRGNQEFSGRKDTNKKDTDEALYDIPRHLLHAGLKYSKDDFNGVLECQYVSARQSSDSVTGEFGSEDAFFIVNTALNYKISKGMTLQFGVNNLLDREFYCTGNMGGEATSGRTYNVGLRYSF